MHKPTQLKHSQCNFFALQNEDDRELQRPIRDLKTSR